MKLSTSSYCQDISCCYVIWIFFGHACTSQASVHFVTIRSQFHTYRNKQWYDCLCIFALIAKLYLCLRKLLCVCICWSLTNNALSFFEVQSTLCNMQCIAHFPLRSAEHIGQQVACILTVLYSSQQWCACDNHAKKKRHAGWYPPNTLKQVCYHQFIFESVTFSSLQFVSYLLTIPNVIEQYLHILMVHVLLQNDSNNLSTCMEPHE